MKRAVHLVSFPLIAACIAALAWLAFSSPPVDSVAAGRFAINDSRDVQFQADPAALETLSATELEDQLRDWLLYSVLAERGLDADALRKSMYDLPPVRAHYLKPVAAFDFGPVRFRVVDGGRSVVALIPQAAPNRNDLLGQVADSVRSTLGDKPAVVQAFEYRIDPVELSAHVSRKPDVPGAELFSASYGYTETSLRGRDDLDQFLKAVDDVVWASSAPQGVLIGGRALTQKRAGRKIGLEDVAALWQSESHLASGRKRVKEFQERWANESYMKSLLEPIYKRELDQISSNRPQRVPMPPKPPGDAAADEPALDPERLGLTPEMRQLPDNLRSSRRKGSAIDAFGLRDDPLDQDLLDQYRYLLQTPRRKRNPGLSGGGVDEADSPEHQQALKQLQERWQNREYVRSKLDPIRQRELAELKKSLAYKGGEQLPPEHSGFSLDPAFDYERLLQLFRELRPQLESMVSQEKLSEAEHGITARDAAPFLGLLYALQQEGGKRRELAFRAQSALQQRSRFQHARYDGTLEGTEVGMVLFYTDLLAKLWALDYRESAPDKVATSGQVRDFVPLLKVGTSPIYLKEMEELSGTRLWFGPRDSGWAKTATGLAFAPIATRVYAASSNSLQPGVEAEPNAASAAFLGWWNDHYRQVADFEPEYHRLNQIMKWSVAIGWLNAENAGDRLDFLGDVPIHRGHWFPDWARQNQQLRFREWDRVPFFSRGHQGVATESMPILVSRPYLAGQQIQALSGGVSLGSRAKIEARPDLTVKIDPLLRRANLLEDTATADRRGFRSLDNTTYTFPTAQPGPAVSVEAKAPGKLRGLDVELKPGTTFETQFQRRAGELRVAVSAGGRSVGALSIERAVASRQVKVMYSALEVEYSRSYARTLSRAESAGQSALEALANRSDVKRIIQANGSFYVESAKPSSPWLKITKVALETNIADSTDIRLAGLGGGGSEAPAQWNVLFLAPKAVEAELPKTGQLLVGSPTASPAAGVAFTLRNKGPPPPPPGTLVVDFDVNPPGEGGILGITKGGGPGGPRGPRDSGPGGRDWDGASDGFAREVALDPDRVLLVAQNRRKVMLDRVDNFLEKGKLEEARLEIDRLSTVFADDPDVIVRRVVAHAAARSPTAAALAARSHLPRGQIPELLAAADRVLPHVAADTVARQRVDAIVRGSLAKAVGKHVRYFGKAGEELGIEVRLAHLVGQPLTGGTSAGSPRYSLAALDVNPELGLPPMPAPSEPVLGRLRDVSVARLRPDVIVDTGTGARYRRIERWDPNLPEPSVPGPPRRGWGGPGPGPGSVGSYRSTYRDFLVPACMEATEEGQRPEECEEQRDVYLVDGRMGAGSRDTVDRRP